MPPVCRALPVCPEHFFRCAWLATWLVWWSTLLFDSSRLHRLAYPQDSLQGTTHHVSNLRLPEDGAKLEEVSLYMEEAFAMVPKGVKTRLDALTESASAARLVTVTNMVIYVRVKVSGDYHICL